MKYNILARFEYNNKTYVYYTELGNNTIRYGYLFDNNIIEITDSKDIKMMNEVSGKLFISQDTKNHIKVGTTKYHGKLFQEMYDKKSELKFFYEIKDGKECLPSNEDAVALFEMFNVHDMFSVYIDAFQERIKKENEEKQKKKKATKIIKTILLYGVAVFAAIEITSCLARVQNNEEQTVQNYEVSVLETSQETVEYTEEDLIRAMDSNQNLSPEEKQIYKNHFEFVMKYKDYTDFEYLIDKLENARITYIEENDPLAAASYAGPYDIYDYGTTSFENTNKSELGHEVSHQCGADHPGMGWGIYEATTEIVSSEHEYASDITTYYDIVGFQKVMYEIIGQDPFGQYQQGGDISNIVKPLMKIINDENYAYQLISALDNLITYSNIANDPYNEYTDEESDEARVNYEKTKLQVIEMLSKYFYLAKGYPMEEDMVSMLYLKKYGIINDDFYIHVDGEIDTYEKVGIYSIKKGYYLKDYIEKNGEYNVVFFSWNYGVLNPTINDSNRRMKKENGIYVVNLDEKNVLNLENRYLGCGLSTAVNELEAYEKSMSMGKPASIEHVEQVNYLKMLYELIGPERIQRYIESGDINVIIKTLAERSHYQEEDIVSLIKSIDMTLFVHDYFSSITDEKSQLFDKNSAALTQLSDNINNKFYVLFYLLNDINMEEDLIINLYYRQIMQDHASNYKSNLGDLFITTGDGSNYKVSIADNVKIEIEKGYIDPEYINQHPYATARIFVPDSSEPISFSINEDNRTMTAEVSDDNITQFSFDEGMIKEK